MMDHLLDELSAAFPAVPLHASMLDDPSSGWDEYYEEHEAFAAGIEGHSWDQLGPEFVEYHHGALNWMTPRAFVAVLPACLHAFMTHQTAVNDLWICLISQLTREPVLLDSG